MTRSRVVKDIHRIINLLVNTEIINAEMDEFNIMNGKNSGYKDDCRVLKLLDEIRCTKNSVLSDPVFFKHF